MGIAERDWARTPAPEEPQEPPVADRWKATMTADGYRIERDDSPEPTLGWADVIFWVIVIAVAGWGFSQ